MRACRLDNRVKPANEDDWRTEYLDAILFCRVVGNVDEAIRHISTYGSAHGIDHCEHGGGRAFLHDLDSAILPHNASTQLADGGEPAWARSALRPAASTRGLSARAVDQLQVRGPWYRPDTPVGAASAATRL